MGRVVADSEGRRRSYLLTSIAASRAARSGADSVVCVMAGLAQDADGMSQQGLTWPALCLMSSLTPLALRPSTLLLAASSSWRHFGLHGKKAWVVDAHNASCVNTTADRMMSSGVEERYPAQGASGGCVVIPVGERWKLVLGVASWRRRGRSCNRLSQCPAAREAQAERGERGGFERRLARWD